MPHTNVNAAVSERPDNLQKSVKLLFRCVIFIFKRQRKMRKNAAKINARHIVYRFNFINLRNALTEPPHTRIHLYVRTKSAIHTAASSYKRICAVNRCYGKYNIILGKRLQLIGVITRRKQQNINIVKSHSGNSQSLSAFSRRKHTHTRSIPRIDRIFKPHAVAVAFYHRNHGRIHVIDRRPCVI